MKALSHTFEQLLEPVSDEVALHTAHIFAKFFSDKVEKIRAMTATAPAPSIQQRTVDPLDSFTAVIADEIVKLITGLPSKQCELDLVPSWLIKQCWNIIAPVTSNIANLSVQNGVFPDCLKNAMVRQRIKQAKMDPTDIKAYKPISNLSFLSQLLEL